MIRTRRGGERQEGGGRGRGLRGQESKFKSSVYNRLGENKSAQISREARGRLLPVHLLTYICIVQYTVYSMPETEIGGEESYDQ